MAQGQPRSSAVYCIQTTGTVNSVAVTYNMAAIDHYVVSVKFHLVFVDYCDEFLLYQWDFRWNKNNKIIISYDRFYSSGINIFTKHYNKKRLF